MGFFKSIIKIFLGVLFLIKVLVRNDSRCAYIEILKYIDLFGMKTSFFVAVGPWRMGPHLVSGWLWGKPNQL